MDSKLKTLFLGSILLNILMFGIVAGHVSHHLSRDYFRYKRVTTEIEKLPESVRQRILTTARDVKRVNQILDDKVDVAREEIFDILKSEPFDETAYREQLQYINSVRSEMSSNLGNAVRELANDLPPEQRAILANIFNDRPRLFPKRR